MVDASVFCYTVDTNRMERKTFTTFFDNTKRVWGMLWRVAPFLCVLFFLTVIVQAVLPFVKNGAQAYLINELVSKNSSAVLVGFVLFVVTGLFMSIIYAFGDYLEKKFWFLTEFLVNKSVAEKKITLDIATQESPGFNDLFQRINDQKYRVQSFTFQYYYLLAGLIEVIVAIVIIGYSSWFITILLLLGTLPELYIGARFGKEVWDIHASNAELRRRFWDLESHVYSLSSITELTLFRNAKKFVGMILQLLHSFHDAELKKEQQRLVRVVLSVIISYSAISFAVFHFAQLVMNDLMQVGTFVFMLTAILDLRAGLSSLFRSMGRQLGDNNFVSDVFHFLDIKPSIDYPSRGVVLSAGKTPVIEFRNVRFTYPNANHESLKGISLKIKSGEKIALVGVNGAGKTTFTKLVCRLYDPTSGEIFLDGVNVKDIDIASWHDKLGVLFQQYAHYRFPVEESIAMGRNGEIIEEELLSASKRAQSHEFIEKYKDGYKQMLGREFGGGVEPSIGQWQKLALARVLYRNPRVYILDEPTASVDPEAEANMFESLKKLPKDRTVILISHRFSTVRHADRIIILDGGVITEEGSHEELMAHNGTYAKLFRLQAEGYK